MSNIIRAAGRVYTAPAGTPEPAAVFNPHTILGRLPANEAVPYILHMRAVHTGAHTRYRLLDCVTCTAAAVRWVTAGIITATELITGPAEPPGEPWTHLGTVTAGEAFDDGPDLRRYFLNTTTTGPARPAARPATAKVTGWDLTETVDTDGRLLCACGCRAVITDRSPSAYFATQACSIEWHETQVSPADQLPDDDDDDTDDDDGTWSAAESFWQGIIDSAGHAEAAVIAQTADEEVYRFRVPATHTRPILPWHAAGGCT